ncbi:MAG: oxygen-independent coproporphyrinogen III oxidase [Armatimonadetes bacterium]|nr:oxygen-independent coproporphyrinogen III oxidase [Armatimonadota bacterium]
MQSEKGASVTAELLKKYDRPGPRYTSYPTAVEFTESFTGETYRQKLLEAGKRREDPLSLYVHLPFCRDRCTFCGCNVIISPHHEVSEKYLDYLAREIALAAEHMPHRRRVSQMHWGGGTPTYQTSGEIKSLFEKITSHFELLPDGEVGIEVDPRVTTNEQIDTLVGLGFNRLSLGVQDFNLEVQQAVNRIQSESLTHELVEYSRSAGFSSVNIDLIYGLPFQTPESFSDTLDSIISLRPDRVAVYNFAHVPWIKGNQKRIDPRTLPSPEVKFALLAGTMEHFTQAGYVQIGMDHFSLPADELARAQAKRTLGRNFMGYTVKAAPDMLGFGVSAIGDVEDSFAQNVKKLSLYYNAIESGRFPIERGYELDGDDKLRRHVINNLMCNFYLDVAETEAKFQIRFKEYFGSELLELASHEANGFVRVAPDSIRVTPSGRFLVRNLCMVFDRYMKQKRQTDKPVFSRTV